MTQGGPHPGDHEHLLDLLAERATDGLSEAQARDLDRLISQLGLKDADAMDRAAAALTLGLTGAPSQAMPDSLKAKIESQAMARLALTSTPTAPLRLAGTPPQTPPRRLVWPAWLAAAACLALAVAGWWPRLAPRTEPDLRAQLANLERADAAAVKIPWTALPDPTAKGASGQVVWSDARQEGYMRFSGLAANDPTKSQYQLWIFTDPNLEPHPVDGGVFDIPAGTSGDVVVKIDPKIRLNKKAAIFAVTVERPGGVVVSDRSRIALLAKPG